MKKYTQLTYRKRIKLETLFSVGMSKFQIASHMKISLKTVYNEWNMGKYRHTLSDLTTEERYSAELAQERHDKNVSARGPVPKLLKDKKLAKCIEQKVADEGLSPEAAVAVMLQTGQMKKFSETVCAKTVYNSIDKGFFCRLTNKNLPVKRNKKKKKNKIHRQKSNCLGKSIEERPQSVETREEFGHVEMDSIIGQRGKQKSTMLTIFERKTRKVIIRKQPDKSAKSVVETLDELERQLGDKFYQMFKTITVDNGSEFADWEGIERSCIYPEKKRTTLYYCHPYSSCERATNENGNRMVRRRVPKGMNFENMTDKEIQEVEDWVNNYPRRMFGFRSSKDLYKEEMKYLI